MAKLPEPKNTDRNASQVQLAIYEAACRERDGDIAKRYSRTDSKRYLGMSQIGDPCERKLWYDFRSFTPKPFEGRLGILFGDGNYYEDKVIKYLRLAGYRLEHTGFEDQLAFSQHGGLFRGHADGMIHGVTQRPHILECKSANKRKFQSFQSAGVRQTYPVYYCQCQCYMGYAGLDRALVVVYCKNDSQIYAERIHFNQHEFSELHERAYRIITANDIPERGYKSQDVMECQWCDFKLHCWTQEGLIMADDRVCGSCWYLSWKGLDRCCLHPDHPYFIRTWGIGCPDWSYLFDKELGPHKLNRKPPVGVDDVREAA